MYGGLGAKPPAAGQFLQFFPEKKTAILTLIGWHFEHFGYFEHDDMCGGLEAKPPAAGQFLQFFRKKKQPI